MIIQYLKVSSVQICKLLFLVTIFLAHSASAQDSQVISVTPPLFQMSAMPGDPFQSVVKVVNGNKYPMTVFTEVVNFEAVGESGQGRFIPILGGEKTTLASWIEIDKGPYVIEPEQSKEIPFFVAIPSDASPGGHYAAILVTTEPPKEYEEQQAVFTSQAVTSLFFLRIEGDVHELATIREFSVLDTLIDKPSAEFSLRFENKGNVHLQPRGDIVITNMWGTERGRIPVNYQTHFGNVLPVSIRDFKFTWESEFEMSDIGRYKAIATLAYGENGVKSVSATTYFWIIPLKATLITLLILGLCIAFIVWMVRAYIRKMLILAGVDPDKTQEEQVIAQEVLQKTTTKTSTHKPRVSEPIQTGVLDLRKRLETVHESVDVLSTMYTFVLSYKKFFISIFVLILMFIGLVFYISSATEERDNYTITIDENGTSTTLDGSEINTGEGN